MNKAALLQQIITMLSHDLSVLTSAARAAHQAATHAECIPDNKYDTTALEASYIAQGQANRSQEIRQSLELYRRLEPREFCDDDPVRLTALVLLEDDDGNCRRIFLGPQGGGLKLFQGSEEIVVITPSSPLGRELIGKRSGDQVELESDTGTTCYAIVEIC